MNNTDIENKETAVDQEQAFTSIMVSVATRDRLRHIAASAVVAGHPKPTYEDLVRQAIDRFFPVEEGK